MTGLSISERTYILYFIGLTTTGAGSSVGSIVGGTVAGVCVLALASVGVTYVVYRRRKRTPNVR